VTPPVMIFAAGLGTRMGALTHDRPKPMIEVAGRPLIDHALAIARGPRPPRIVVNTHAHAALIEAHLAATAPDVLISHEPERLETGGGLQAALPLLAANPVFTLNADAVWTPPNPLTLLARAWDPARMGALLVLVPRAEARAHAGPGDFFLDDAGRLAHRGDAPSAPYVFAGAQLLDPSPLAAMPAGAFSLWAVWKPLLAAGRLHGVVHPGPWVDVGRPDGIAAAEALSAASAEPTPAR
jgi:N-acetyl-alpha-D-muramate 1-phosphate uridylyltransferase